MPKWLKIVLILLIVGILGLAALVGGVVYWVSANKDRLAATGKNAQEEGVRFASTHTQDQCVDNGMSHLKDCGAMEFMCEAGNKIRLMSCVQNAQHDDTCKDVPGKGEIFKMATWANDECSRRGHSGSQPCARLVQAIPEACARDDR